MPPAGFESAIPNKWTATDPRLRLRGPRGRQIILSLPLNIQGDYTGNRTERTFADKWITVCEAGCLFSWKVWYMFQTYSSACKSQWQIPVYTSVGVFINVDSVKLIAITLTLDSYVITSSLRSPVKSTSVCDNRAFKTKVSLYARSPLVNLSRRALSGRWSSFGKRVWFTESHIVLIILFSLYDLFIHFFLNIK